MKGNTFFALLSGAAVGVAITLFLTSEKGREMRGRIGEWAEDEKDKIKDRVDRMRYRGEEFVDDFKEGVERAKHKAQEALCDCDK